MNTKTLPQPPAPCLDLYAQVRSGFVRQHTTLNRWCQANQVKRQNARKALLGEWTGRKAGDLRERLITAAGVRAELFSNPPEEIRHV